MVTPGYITTLLDPKKSKLWDWKVYTHKYIYIYTHMNLHFLARLENTYAQAIIYLQGQGNLVRRLITPIITPSILIVNLITKLLVALNLSI